MQDIVRTEGGDYMCVICGCNREISEVSSSKSDSGTLSPTINGQNLHFGKGDASLTIPGLSQRRSIKIEADVLGENQRLCATIDELKKRASDLPLAVIEGDQQTSVDADRIRATGVEAIQVNTGKGCHLDAQMVSDAFSHLHIHSHDHSHTVAGHSYEDSPLALLLIENVGNLVCPAMWDLGEAAKVVILSVTEGDDKPLKYPDMFASAQLLIINKIDLLPYVDFNVDTCIEHVRRIQPDINTITLSATTGEGIENWLKWLLNEH